MHDAFYSAKFLANVVIYEVEHPADSEDNDLNVPNWNRLWVSQLRLSMFQF